MGRGDTNIDTSPAEFAKPGIPCAQAHLTLVKNSDSIHANLCEREELYMMLCGTFSVNGIIIIGNAAPPRGIGV